MQPSAGIGVDEVQKLEFFFFFFLAFLLVRARPSAGIGVDEVQKLEVCFCVFVGARATLCGDRRG